MSRTGFRAALVSGSLWLGLAASTAAAATQAVEVTLRSNAVQPYSTPRPYFNDVNIPLAGSFYVQLSLVQGAGGDTVNLGSVNVTLQKDGGPLTNVVQSGAVASGFHGTLQNHFNFFGYQGYADLYVTPDVPLLANTHYTLRVTSADSVQGAHLSGAPVTWGFTTEGAAGNTTINTTLDLTGTAVNWTGVFYGGIVQSPLAVEPDEPDGIDLFDVAHAEQPKAFSIQRGLSVGGQFTDAHGILTFYPTYTVQELETRRVNSIADDLLPNTTALTTVDFFGHEQYGIPSGRWIGDDYHAGDYVVIADRYQTSLSQIFTVDAYGIIWLHKLDHAANTWSLTADYQEHTPFDAGVPGNFPEGGTYIYRYTPAGTPMYYWGRLDEAGDRAITTHGRRMVSVGFIDAPGGLSIDGHPGRIPKDWVEFHQVAYDVTTHLIQRYGSKAATFKWGLFNEPDLGLVGADFRFHWDNLQRFYDYYSDAVLRAFEDAGYDSTQIKVGGLELGAIGGPPDFGLPGRLDTFLAHCSPTATSTDPMYVATNAAYADARLIGPPDLRSTRVKNLCGAHGGKGTPLDWVSLHAYNTSANLAAKLIRGKDMALALDATTYANLSVDSFESAPNWAYPPDPAATAANAGDGFHPSWTMDFVARLLAKGKLDARYTKTDTALTLWGFPDGALSGGIQAFTSRIGEDTSVPPDGTADQQVDVKEDVFNAATLLASMGDSYYVLPQVVNGGHVFGGFGTKTSAQARVMLYDHNSVDYETRSGKTFTINLTLSHLPSNGIRVRQYRIDKSHNSYFPARQTFGVKGAYTPAEVDEILTESEVTQTGPAQTRCVTAGSATVTVDLSPNGLNFLVVGFQPTCVGAPDSVGVYDPSARTFYLRDDRNGANYVTPFVFNPAATADTPIGGDWNGDGIDSIGLTTPNGSNYMFYERNALSSGPPDISSVYDFWNVGWRTLVGDWNGDGIVTEGTMNPANNNFAQRNAHYGFSSTAFYYGTAGAGVQPFGGDWNGDSVATIGYYDTTTATVHLRNANNTGPDDVTFTYGTPGAGWIAIAGDWNADGIDTVGLYDPATSTFHLRNTNDAGPDDQTFVYGTPGAGWKPVAGCWRGK